MTDRPTDAPLEHPLDHLLEHSAEGPWLRTLTDRLVTTPEPFLRQDVVTEAVLRDALEMLAGAPLEAEGLDAVRRLGAAALPERLAAQVAAYLLTEPALHDLLTDRAPREIAMAVGRFTTLVGVVPLRQWFGDDPDRHEEVVRALLRCLAIRPRGESHAQAEDRWQSVSTGLRSDALRLAALEQQRADELARALADRRAQEAAAQYTHV